MKYTANLKLKKPEGADVVNIDDLNDNVDILDREIKRIEQEGGKVKSVNGKTGEVVLKGEDIKLNDGKDIEEKLKNIDREYLDIRENTRGTVASNLNLELVTSYADRQINVSVDSSATNRATQVNSSSKSTASGLRSQINASENCNVTGQQSQINTSSYSSVEGNYSQVNSSSSNCKAISSRSQINACTGCTTNGVSAQVNSSRSSSANGDFSQINACDLRNVTVGNYSQINASGADNSIDANSTYSQINASQNSTTTANFAQVNASDRSRAGWYGVVSASQNCDARGISTSIIASNNCMTNVKQTTSSYSAIIASGYSETLTDGGTQGFQVIIGSANSRTKSAYSTVMCSSNVLMDNTYTISGGYSTAPPSTKNRKWEINSTGGTIRAFGTITQNHTFTDYAEYFESVDGTAIPTGTLVALEGDKIRIATSGDEMLGVISETAGVVLGACGFHWQDRYLRNEFGGLIYQTIKDPNWKPPTEQKPIYETNINPETGEEEKIIIDYELVELPYTEDDIPNITVPIENPEHNMEEEYVPREERDEWNIVGLIGQVYIKCDNTLSIGDYIKVGRDGMATKDDNPTFQRWRVMKITTPYSEEKGYGVAFVFIR